MTGGFEPRKLICLTGPKTPALSTLWKKFKEDNDIQGAFESYDKFGDMTTESLDKKNSIRFQFEIKNDWMTIEEIFIKQLQERHKFTEAVVETVLLK